MRRDSSRDADGWLSLYDGRAVVRIDSLPKNRGGPKLVINLKGCNGSGKSTVPMEMLKHSNWFFVTAYKADKKPIGVWVPNFDTVILGTYLTNCGGCDSLGNTQVVKDLLMKLWFKDVHIMYEGVIVGDIRETFYNVMKGFSAIRERTIHFCFMGTKLKECLARIQSRNGGKVINEEMVASKYRNSIKHLKYYLSQGDVNCAVLNTSGSKEQVYQRFLAMYPELRSN